MSRGLALCLLLVGCGRSSLIGHSPEDCPPALLNPDGTCAIGDGGRSGDLGDGGPSQCPSESACVDNCANAGCCACAACSASLLCKSFDMGGDGPDICGDPQNCKLPVCAGDPRCHVLGKEICNNCIDDNGDGLIDCADPQCTNFPGCQPGHMCPSPPDCSDPTCACGPLCKDLKCHPTVDFGDIAPMNSSSTRMVNTTGTTDTAITPCAPGGAGMVIGKFNLTGMAAVVLSFMQGKGEDHVFSVYYAGTNQNCAANPVENACYDPKSATSGQHTYILPAGEYYVIVQPYEPAGQGPVTVTLSTGCATQEICNNGIDDNCNGLVDCADPQCFNAPNCVMQECMPDINIGTLVVNDPGKTVSFDTHMGDTVENVTCESMKGGGDTEVRFQLAETAGIRIQWDQTGDHVIGIMRMPQPGEPCDFNQISCYDPSGRMTDDVAMPDMPPGDYVLIWKALKPGAEGHVDATISAFRSRTVTCGNATECADPKCFGNPLCFQNYCKPDVQLGTMNPGDQQSVHLDVASKGINGYTNVSCARTAGGGKGMVVQLTIGSVGSLGGAGIGFDCHQTGDQVIDLFAAGGPRDRCDIAADEQACADPKTLPFGCGYEVPNLQKGTYNVIVEAYAPGSEGTMDLTLSIIDDRQLVDCSQPGACTNRQCVTTQYCQGAQCKADAMLDPMPLDGNNHFVLVQTAMNGVHGQVPCATKTGGQSAAIEIGLTAAADLKMSWNQIGGSNHDFALFTDAGTALPCDAGTLTGMCTQSKGAATGMASFTNVPQGKYYLLVQGDQPDGTTQYSGSVDVALAGTPH